MPSKDIFKSVLSLALEIKENPFERNIHKYPPSQKQLSQSLFVWRLALKSLWNSLEKCQKLSPKILPPINGNYIVWLLNNNTQQHLLWHYHSRCKSEGFIRGSNELNEGLIVFSAFNWVVRFSRIILWFPLIVRMRSYLWRMLY